MSKALRSLTFALLLCCGSAAAQAPTAAAPSPAVAKGIEQLRQHAGEWAVTTEFLAEDGSVAKSVEGSYAYRWVVPDRVLAGESRIPEMEQVSGFLLYLREGEAEIEMASVGADGKLWVMTGPADGESRVTPPVPTVDGGSVQLRFTRYDVQPDRFFSKMEYSTDAGKTWVQGNRQTFRRKP